MPGRPLSSSLRRLLVFLLVVILLAGSWLAAFGYLLWRQHEETLSRGFERATTHARNFEEHLTQTLQAIDLTASSFDVHAPTNTPEVIGQRLIQVLRPAAFLRSISLVNAEGLIVASSEPANIGQPVDMGSFFPATDVHSPLLRIANAWQGRDFYDGTPARATSGEAGSFIPVLRRLPGNDAPLWLLVALNPDYFLTHALQLVGQDQGSVQWLRYDDRLLFSTAEGDLPGQPRQGGLLGQHLEQRELGQFAQVLAEGRSVLTAYRASSQFPVLIAVHLDRDALLAAWEAESRQLATILLPVLLALGVSATLYWRRQRKIRLQEEELARQRGLTASVFDASMDAIMITSPEGNILSVNAAFEHLTGYPPGEVVGRNPRLLKSGLHDADFYQTLWTRLREQDSWQGEVINRRKTGELRTFLLRINAVRDSAGHLLHHVGVATDISDRKAQEQELIQARDAAESANIAKSRFLATISHEIRTPLNAILGMAQLLRMETLTPQERQDYAGTIVDSGQTLLTLLNDILDFSKIESGKVGLESIPFSPEKLLEASCTLFTKEAHAQGLTLTAHWAGDPGASYLGDPHRLQQMLNNFTSNALKFTPAGRITLTARETRREAGQAELEFCVADTGIGIPEDKHALLFQPFSQADNSTTRQFGGTGLGLSIVERLARQMGGTTGFSSQPGEGSRFWFRLTVPCLTADAPRPARPPADSGAPAPLSGHVLVVEDNRLNQKVITALLGKLGLTADVAEDGQAALDYLQAGHAVALVLMDVQMPVMDGLTATRALRAWEEATQRPRLPVIALTADAFDAMREECAGAGMDDFLTKPIASDQLTATVRRWLPASAASTGDPV